MNFLKGSPTDVNRPDNLRLSVAILLLEAAHRGDTFADEERAAIERLLAERFHLTPEQCGELLALGEEAVSRMVQLHPHTHAVLERMTPDERIQLIEMLWEVAYADGVLDSEEDALIRRIAGLIYVEDRDRVLARKRVRKRLGLEG